MTVNRANIQITKISPDFVYLRTLFTDLAYIQTEFSADGSELIVNGGEQVYSVPEFSLKSEGTPAPTPEWVAQDPNRWLPFGFGDNPRGIVFLSGGNLYLWGGTNPVWRWDPLSGETTWIDFDGDLTSDPSISRERTYVAACFKDRLEVRAFGTTDTYTHARCLDNTVLAFLPDRDVLARARNNQIKLFNPFDGSHIQDFNTTGFAISWLDFSPSGKYFASGGEVCGYGGCVGDQHLWQIDPARGMTLVWEGSEQSVSDIVFTHDDSRMISAKGIVWLWEPATGLQKGKLPLYGDKLAVSPDGQLAAVSNNDRIINLISLETREIVAQFPAHPYVIIALAFTTDGANLLSLDAGGGLRAWGLP